MILQQKFEPGIFFRWCTYLQISFLHNSRYSSMSNLDTDNSLSKHQKGKDCYSLLQSSFWFVCLSSFFQKSKSLKRQHWILFLSSWNNVIFFPSVFELYPWSACLPQNSLSNSLQRFAWMSTLFWAAHLLFRGTSQLCMADSRRFQRHIKSILMEYPIIQFMATDIYLT